MTAARVSLLAAQHPQHGPGFAGPAKADDCARLEGHCQLSSLIVVTTDSAYTKYCRTVGTYTSSL